VEQISRIGMDTAKHIFQLHGVNTAEEPVLRKKLRRKEMFAFLEKLAPTVIAIEACGASHHCARLLQSFGHSVKLIAPQLVKPYIKRGKNDAADAEALCEAMSRPTMRFVPVKTAEQQAARYGPHAPPAMADRSCPGLCDYLRPWRASPFRHLLGQNREKAMMGQMTGGMMWGARA
jgi:Transposase